MPELPEVETVVRTLAPHLLNQRLRAVRLLRPDIVTPAGIDLPDLLTGRTVESLRRRGKKIILGLDDGNCLYIHLGMSGRLTIERPEAPVAPHTHLVMALAQCEVRFRDPRRFGGVWWCGVQTAPDAGMGPEPFDIRAAQLYAKLARSRRPVKAVLLDQAVIAGLGNIYVDEALFRAQIHPQRVASDVSKADAQRLNRAIKATLRRAIRHRGSTLRDYRDANGSSGGFQLLHFVYQRYQQPCRKCKVPIGRIVVGGRTTHFCPACQPSPTHSTARLENASRRTRQ